jgi:hypothetical protein
MSAEWIAISKALADATEKAAAHAVALHAGNTGAASGIIWRSPLIVTAEHALRRAEEIQVTLADAKIASPARGIRGAIRRRCAFPLQTPSAGPQIFLPTAGNDKFRVYAHSRADHSGNSGIGDEAF